MRRFLVLCVLLGIFSTGLSRPADAAERLKLATTTSTDNSGLLKWLHPVFEKMYGVQVHVIAVGTGQALRLGQNGDVDVVLVHARKAEEAFVAAGYGVDRREVMYNDFVIVGPASDPAGVKGLREAADALRLIMNKKALWFSRGDDSGTHKKEKQFWSEIGSQPKGAWYRSLGQGMGRTLLIADEKRGYVLTDRGTYIALSSNKKISLKVLVERGKSLLNPYSVIRVNPKRHLHVNSNLARQYADFLVSQEGQNRIASFRLSGKVLFHPSARPVPGN
ncbi:MAG: substrate-binding domain-containing protein [bacterium]|nr:substrate-binding domain-containing protein [bacterium]